jgi:hypothetical protein
MIDLDDDDDALLFDERDENEDGFVPTNFLVVPPRPPSAEMLNQLERAYRSQGLPACVFIEDGEDGLPFVGNALALGRAMGFADLAVTEQQFDNWAAQRQWADWTWT